MTDVDPTILEKIRKVQGYTKSSNVNEAAVAAAKLTELLLKYNLEASQIPSDSAKVDPFSNERMKTGQHYAVEWKMKLAGIIARANLVRTVIDGPEIVWLGRASNVEVARYIYDTVVADLENMAAVFWALILDWHRNNPDKEIVHGRVYKQQFYAGAVDAIRERLQTDVQNLRSDANMNALIVRNDSELSKYVASIFPSLTTRNYRKVYGNGYAIGKNVGANVQFKTGVGAGGSTATRRLGSGN